MRPHLFATALTLWAAQVAAQVDVSDPRDPYVHEQTGMAFPLRIAGSTRHQVVRYSDDGADGRIGYQVARDGHMVAYVSIFVYPAPPSSQRDRKRACAEAWEGIKQEVMSHEPGARPGSDMVVPSPSAVY